MGRSMLVVVVAVASLASGTAAAQTVGPGGAIPVIANLPGLAGTFWQSDVSIVNLDSAPTTVTLTLLPEIRGGGPLYDPMVETVTVPAGGQRTLSNVVQATFGMIDAKGALSVVSQDGSPLLLSSRTFTSTTDGGTYGQDIHGVLVGRRAWIGGLRHDAAYRTNIGVYLPVNPQLPATQTVFTVIVRDQLGAEVARGSYVFPAAGVVQRSLSAFGVDVLVDGHVEIECDDPSITWYAYGSRVDQLTGDAVYRAAKGFAADLP